MGRCPSSGCIPVAGAGLPHCRDTAAWRHAALGASLLTADVVAGPVVVTLPEAVTVTGTIRDLKGNPVSNQPVVLSNDARDLYWTGQTDGDGNVFS